MPEVHNCLESLVKSSGPSEGVRLWDWHVSAGPGLGLKAGTGPPRGGPATGPGWAEVGRGWALWPDCLSDRGHLCSDPAETPT